jgi:hypothetical protein
MGGYRERADLRAYTEILLSLLTICIFSIFALKPTLVTIAQLLKEIDSKKETLVTIDAKIKKLSQAQILFDQYRSKVELLDSALPEKSSPAVIIRQIEGLSSTNKINISSMTLGENVIIGENIPVSENIKEEKDAAIPNSGTLPLTILSQNQIDLYPQIVNFLSDIERLRIALKIESITLSIASNNIQNDGNISDLSFLLNGNIYYYLGSTKSEMK